MDRHDPPLLTLLRLFTRTTRFVYSVEQEATRDGGIVSGKSKIHHLTTLPSTPPLNSSLFYRSNDSQIPPPR